VDWTEIKSVCRSCFSHLDGSKGGSKQPSFSAPANFSHGIDIPDVLKGLSFAEEALICIFQPAMAATTIKGGQRSLRGHVTFFDRTASVDSLADLLPRLASDVETMELEREVGSTGGRMQIFVVRRHVSLDNLAQLPINGQLDIGVVPRLAGGHVDDEDLGPAPAQRRFVDHDDGFIPTSIGGTLDGAAVRNNDMAARVAAHADRIASLKAVPTMAVVVAMHQEVQVVLVPVGVQVPRGHLAPE